MKIHLGPIVSNRPLPKPTIKNFHLDKLTKPGMSRTYTFPNGDHEPAVSMLRRAFAKAKPATFAVRTINKDRGTVRVWRTA